MQTLLKIGDAVRDTVNMYGYNGDARHDSNVNNVGNLKSGGSGGVEPQFGTTEYKVAKDGEALSKRSAKAKQEREKGFKPSQYKTRMCRRCAALPCGLPDSAHRCVVQPKPCCRIVLRAAVRTCSILFVRASASSDGTASLCSRRLSSRSSLPVAGGTR
jgi:hypothetical protein